MTDHLAIAIWKALRFHPEDWSWSSPGSRSITHRSSLTFYPYINEAYAKGASVKFGFMDRRKLGAAYRRWRRVQGNSDAIGQRAAAVNMMLAMLESA